MLRLVLSAHPLITITPETHFIEQLFHEKIALHKKLSQKKFAIIIELMKADVKLRSWPAFQLDDFLEKILRQSEITIAHLLDELFLTFAELTNGGTVYLGNKKGLYAKKNGIQIKKKVFPDAKFIYIVRDPRDIIRSILKNLRKLSLIEGATKCSSRDYYICRMKELFPDDVLVIRYEDLVTTPAVVCQGVCGFLQITFNEKMLKFHELNHNSARLMGLTKYINQNTMSLFNPKMIGQWKKEGCFSIEELKTIESVTCKYMKNYHYTPVTVSGDDVCATIPLNTFTRFW